MADDQSKQTRDATHPSHPTCEPLHPRQPPEPLARGVDGHSAVPAAPDGNAQDLDLLFRLSCDGLMLHELLSQTEQAGSLRVNDVVCQLLGYSAEEMCKLTLRDVVSPEGLSNMPDSMAAMEPDSVRVCEKELLAKGGRHIVAEISVRRFDLADRQRVLSSIHDITRRKKAEQALRESEQGRAIGVIGVMYDITQHKQMEAELRRLTKRLEEEVEAQTEELRETIDGLQNEMSRRVTAEDQLRDRSRMLEAFFRHTITPLVFLDLGFNFIRVNNAYARAAGEGPEYFAGKNYFSPPSADRDRCADPSGRRGHGLFEDAAGLALARFRQRLGLGDLAISDRLDHLKHLGPGRERPGVGPLVFLNGHEEFKLLIRHVAVLRGPAVVAAPPAWAATAVQPEASVHDALSPVLSAAAFDEIRIARVGLVLASIRQAFPPVLSAAALRHGHVVCL